METGTCIAYVDKRDCLPAGALEKFIGYRLCPKYSNIDSSQTKSNHQQVDRCGLGQRTGVKKDSATNLALALSFTSCQHSILAKIIF